MGARREAALALALISVVSALTMEGMKKVGDKIVERQKKNRIISQRSIRRNNKTGRSNVLLPDIFRLDFLMACSEAESLPRSIRVTV